MTRLKLPATFKLGELTLVSVGGGEAIRMPAYGDAQKPVDEPRAIPQRLDEMVRTLVAFKKQSKKR